MCGTGQGQRALRAGRWTKAEEMYAAQLVIEFNSGLLPMPDGRMLRMFLAKALNCDPMRISKKFVGNSASASRCKSARCASLAMADEY